MEFYTVDTGKQGALLHFRDEMPVAAYEIPYDGNSFIDLDPLINELGDYPVYIEKINAIPQQSSKTTAIQFQGYGALVSCFNFISSEVVMVHYLTWQAWAKKELNLLNGTKFTKDHSRDLATKFWPEFSQLQITGRKRKLPDGIADALCLGAWVLTHANKAIPLSA